MEFSKYLASIGLKTYVAFDLETTGLDPVNDFIIEFGAVKVVDGKIAERMQQFIKPPIPIPPFITKITTITDEMVAEAPELEAVMEQIFAFLGDFPLVGHNVMFDYGFLQQKRSEYDGKDLENPLLDTLYLSRTFRYDLVNHRLGDIAEYYGLSAEGTHRADYDAELTGELLLKFIGEMARGDQEVFQNLVEIHRSVEMPNKLLFINILNHLRSGKKMVMPHGFTPEPIPSPPNIRDIQRKEELPELADIFEKNGSLAAQLSGYEPRPAQSDMARDIEQIMTNNEFLVAESGTGVGKSLAYTVPSVLTRYRLEEEAPLIISCNTKNLQDQLFHKEIPFIQEKLGIGMKAILLKGRSNYICKNKWTRAMRDLDWFLSDREKEEMQTLVLWLRETRTGDIDEHNGFSTGRASYLWSKLCSEPGFCTTAVCQPFEHCFLGKIRRETHGADVIVVNHSLLLSDAAAGHSILPRYERLVVDEGHLLEKNAYQFFASEFSYYSLRNLLDRMYYRARRMTGLSVDLLHYLVPLKEEEKTDVLQQVEDIQNATQEASNASESFFQEFRQQHLVKLQHSKFMYKELYTAEKELFAPVANPWQELIVALGNLQKLLETLRRQLDDIHTDGVVDLEEYLLRLDGFREELQNTFAIMDSQAAANEAGMIYWFEMSPREDDINVRFIQVPLRVGNVLQTALYEDLSSAVFTSATLAVNDSFEYYMKRTGLLENDRVVTRLYPSPFSYEDQARAFVPLFLGYTKDPNYTERVISALEEIWQAHPVGTLILFTSYSQLLEWEGALTPIFKHSNRKLLVQNNQVSRVHLINTFKNEPGSVLLATDSFWQGIDIPGDALQLLVVAKLPFQVPSEPIVRANQDDIRMNSGNDFMEYAVPEAAIKYKQGIGRLIRTMSDYGAVISLDDRLFTKRYGSYFINSTPIPHVAARTKEDLIGGVVKWLASHQSAGNG
ncbi:MAG: hypothetical protein K9N11_07210 [Lentisphaeria bacterium]|nr:hypothetical protein [Candidatus Neomarinimicrobiota bacterium]MCF7842625.1 hypothetical protein [Lentisphaeria bacterium]